MTTGLLTTTAGRNAIIADLGGGADLVLTHVAWGDANGVPYNPNEAQVALVNEKYRATIASVAVVGGAIVVDAVIPADTNDGTGRPSHGFSVAEVGLFSSTGTLIGVARCGNGYKPPPSSGQAHDVTYRLKLAVANPSAITVVIDPVAQVNVGRHVRPFWITVDGILNDPPAAPVAGATYVIGAAPTGAWAGFAHRIAQWVGVWALASVPIGHHVVDNSKGRWSGARWLERTATGWEPGISRLVQRQPGNIATQSGGDGNTIVIAVDPAPAAMADLVGQLIRIKLLYLNSGAVVINAGFGNVPLRNLGGGEMVRGQLVPGYIEVAYDGDQFQLLGMTPGLFARGGRQVFSGNGTWVCPAGVYSVYAEVLGGGGSGGNSTTAGDAASGGNGGAFGAGFYDVVPGTAYPVTVGQGGAIAPAGANNGNTGGSSSFAAFLTANGGYGGVASNGGGIQNIVQPNATVSGANVRSLIGSQSQPAYSTGASVIVQSPGGPPATGGTYGDRVGVSATGSANGKNAVTQGQGGNGSVGNAVGGGGQAGLVSLYW